MKNGQAVRGSCLLSSTVHDIQPERPKFVPLVNEIDESNGGKSHPLDVGINLPLRGFLQTYLFFAGGPGYFEVRDPVTTPHRPVCKFCIR